MKHSSLHRSDLFHKTNPPTDEQCYNVPRHKNRFAQLLLRKTMKARANDEILLSWADEPKLFAMVGQTSHADTPSRVRSFSAPFAPLPADA